MSWKIWIILFTTTVIIEFTLLANGVELAASMIIVLVAVLGGYLFFWGIKNKRLNDILEEKCDPVKFIEEWEKAKSLSKRVPYQNLCNVNIAVGLISMGRNSEALDFLQQNIDLRVKNSKIFETAYHLTVFCCYMNMGDLKKAALEHEEHLKELRKSALPTQFIFAIDVSFSEYQYKLHETEETAKVFLEQLKYLQNIYSKKISTKSKLNILYNKACIMQALGDYEGAAEKYKLVAKHGNGLWIAEVSRTKY